MAALSLRGSILQARERHRCTLSAFNSSIYVRRSSASPNPPGRLRNSGESPTMSDRTDDERATRFYLPDLMRLERRVSRTGALEDCVAVWTVPFYAQRKYWFKLFIGFNMASSPMSSDTRPCAVSRTLPSTKRTSSYSGIFLKPLEFYLWRSVWGN